MNYELAKQLKKAGFPQEGKEGRSITKEPGCPHFGSDEWKENPNFCGCFVYHPTLSELIDACGDSFELLGTNRRHGFYMGQPPIIGYVAESFLRNNLRGEGLTPEEAVARLWLALNKK